MTRAELIDQIRQKQSYLCIGLDPDLDKLPKHLLQRENPVLEFCREIIAATADHCVAYKPNLAFFEALGSSGWETLAKVRQLIPSSHFIIADAKRGDIGNTAGLYAKAFFEQLTCDAVTVAPYMGRDSVTPFLQHEGKWAILLALTSNPGAADFQLQPLVGSGGMLINDGNVSEPVRPYLKPTEAGESLWSWVIRASEQWGTDENMMYVIGATRPEYIQQVRQLAPNHFLLVPGVGAQGGSMEEVSRYGLTAECGLLVNASRFVLYASSGEDFAMAAQREAKVLQQEMAQLLRQYSFTSVSV